MKFYQPQEQNGILTIIHLALVESIGVDPYYLAFKAKK